MKRIRKPVFVRTAVFAALLAIFVETGLLLAGRFPHPISAAQNPIPSAEEDDPYRVPVVPPVAHPESASAKAWEAGAPKEGNDYWNWRDKRVQEALARQKTVPAADAWKAPFPDDDSLTAYFWRRYQKAEYLRNCASTQFELNVCASQASVSLEWMLDAMIAEIRLLYADNPEFLVALNASQKVWKDFTTKAEDRLRDEMVENCGSSAMMEFYYSVIPAVLRRINELTPWLMGVGEQDGYFKLSGSPSANDEIAYRKEKLRAFGLWPLRPENIGADTTYGDQFLQDDGDNVDAGDAGARKNDAEEEPESGTKEGKASGETPAPGN
jgi:hypothetical protein